MSVDTLYLLQSPSRLLLRRAIGCFAFPAHASVSSDHTPLITRTRYLLLLFPTGRLSPCARPLELPASQASQSRHILLIPDFLCFFLGNYIIISIKNHFYKMKRDIGMVDYEKLVKQEFHTPSIEFHTPSLYLCFFM